MQRVWKSCVQTCKGLAFDSNLNPLGLTPVKSLYKFSEHCKIPQKPNLYVTTEAPLFIYTRVENAKSRGKNDIGATESLSILVAELITARPININTDYLLSNINKARRGCMIKIRKHDSHPELQEQVLFYPSPKLLCFSGIWEAIKHTHTDSLAHTHHFQIKVG